MMTPSQKKVLEILESLNGGFATAKMIQAAGGHCASLPKLIEMGLVKKKVYGINNIPVWVWFATMEARGKE